MERKGPEVVARESDRPGNFLGFISTALWLPREEQPAIVLGMCMIPVGMRREGAAPAFVDGYKLMDGWMKEE